MLELPGDGGIPPLRLSVPSTVRVPGIPEGTVFVPDIAGARVSLTISSTFTRHVTHLMLINLSAGIIINNCIGVAS